MASVTRSNRQKSKTNALKFGGMRTTDTKPGRSVNPLETERPIGLFSSLKIELSVLITISTAIAFIMAWFLLKVGLSVWIAMPITLAVALGITYFFSRGLTSPLRQMRDAAEAWRKAITPCASMSTPIVAMKSASSPSPSTKWRKSFSMPTRCAGTW